MDDAAPDPEYVWLLTLPTQRNKDPHVRKYRIVRHRAVGVVVKTSGGISRMRDLPNRRLYYTEEACREAYRVWIDVQIREYQAQIDRLDRLRARADDRIEVSDVGCRVYRREP